MSIIEKIVAYSCEHARFTIAIGALLAAAAVVAAVPFLWILPLSLYLLSFILCFAGNGWYRRNPYLQLLAVALGSMAYAVAEVGNMPFMAAVVLFSLGLFVCSMA